MSDPSREESREYMGTRESAKAALVEKSRAWRELRQPSMDTAAGHRKREAKEHEARFQLANAALLWLWHEENPDPRLAASPEARERVVEAATLARRLCQLFDSGGESQRTVRARYASAIFQLLHDENPQHEAEQAKCDADPVQYLKDAEDRALKGTSP